MDDSSLSSFTHEISQIKFTFFQIMNLNLHLK